jgi:hypothetical protein
MSARLEKLLSLLTDNVWHSTDEIATALNIPQPKIQQIITLLAETELVQHNPATNQIKINQNWKTLLTNPAQQNPEQQTPTTLAICTMIIPPQQTLIIQCTRITNQTDTSLELGIRMDNRIREIAINKIK